VSKCLKQEKTIWKRIGCVQPNTVSVWVHRTVRWCTGQCPVRQDHSRWTVRSWDSTTAYDYKSQDCPVVHRTVRWVVCGEPTVVHRIVRWANGRPRNPRVTRGRANGLMGAPDCPVCTEQCPVRQRLQIFNGRVRQFRKAICTRHWTVPVRWHTGLSGAPPDRRQEHNNKTEYSRRP
jgi:hypothetical protein